MAATAAPVLGLAAGLRPPHQPCWSPACPPPWGKAPRVCRGSHFEGWGEGRVEPPPREACRRTPPNHSSAQKRHCAPGSPLHHPQACLSAPSRSESQAPAHPQLLTLTPPFTEQCGVGPHGPSGSFLLDLSEILNTHPCPFLGSSGRFRAEPGSGPALGQINLGVRTISVQ